MEHVNLRIPEMEPLFSSTVDENIIASIKMRNNFCYPLKKQYKKSKVERAIIKWGAIENNILKWHQNLIHILVVPIIFWLTIHI